MNKYISYIVCGIGIVLGFFIYSPKITYAYPAAPSNLTATILNDYGSYYNVQLSWTDNSSDEAGFIVKEFNSQNTLASTGANVTSITTNVFCGSFMYYVYSIDGSGGTSGSTSNFLSFQGPCAPAAPTNLSATVVSGTQINLSWTDNANNETSFAIRRGIPYSAIGTVGANITTYSNTSVTCETQYSYYVTAQNSVGASANSNTVTVTSGSCDVTPPTPNPPTVTASVSNQTTATVTLSTGSDAGIGLHATPYGISTDGSNYIWYTSNSQTISGLSCGTSYTMYGKIRDAAGNMTNAGTSSSITTDACTPGMPQNVSATATGQTTGSATWTNTGAAASGYEIYSWNGASKPLLATISGPTTSAIFGGLSCGSSYYIIVKAFVDTNGRRYYSGESSYSNGITTSSCVTPPATPTTFRAQHASSYTYFFWNDVASDETGFKIYRDGSLFATVAANPGASSVSYYDWNTPTSKHTYYIVAYKDPGAVESSRSNSATTPGPITTISATAIDSASIRINWTEINTEQSSVNLYASVNGNWNYISSTPNSGAQTAVVSAPCGISSVPIQMVAYYYDSYGAGHGWVYGSTVYATVSSPVQCPPTAASGLSVATASKTQLNLSWTDNSNNESGFYIYRNGSYITAVGANTTSYNDTGVACGTAYNYYVVAYNGGGNAGASNTASGTTSSCVVAPSAVTINSISQVSGISQINLLYSGSANGYFIVRNRNNADEAVFDITTTSTSLSNLKCPSDYTIKIYAYNSDTSLGGADPGGSCNAVQNAGATVTNKLCSTVTSGIKLIRHCTQGFLTD